MATPFSGTGFTSTLNNNIYTITFINNGNISFSTSIPNVHCLVVGGGGGGAKSTGAQSAPGGGGGSGGVVIYQNINVTQNLQYNIFVEMVEMVEPLLAAKAPHLP
jgi:hypothetical protein